MTGRLDGARFGGFAAGLRFTLASVAATLSGVALAQAPDAATAGRPAPEAHLATTAIFPGGAPVSAARAATPEPGRRGAEAAGCRVWVYAPAQFAAPVGPAVIPTPPAQGAIPAPPASRMVAAPPVAMATAPATAQPGAPAGPAGGQATQGGAAGAHGAGASAGGASPTGAGAALPASPAADAGPWLCREWRAAAQ